MRDILFEKQQACRIPVWIPLCIPAQTLSRHTLNTCKCLTEEMGLVISYPQQAIC